MESLNFNNTCPSIDDALDYIKTEIDEHLDVLLTGVCPYIDSVKKQELINEIIFTLYDKVIVGQYEDIRQLNSDMRSQAEDQLNELASERDEYVELYEELKDKQ